MSAILRIRVYSFFVGIGLMQSNALALIASAMLPIAAYVYRIRVEETALEQGLGARYTDYATGRRRLLPGVW